MRTWILVLLNLLCLPSFAARTFSRGTYVNNVVSGGAMVTIFNPSSLPQTVTVKETTSDNVVIVPNNTPQNTTVEFNCTGSMTINGVPAARTCFNSPSTRVLQPGKGFTWQIGSVTCDGTSVSSCPVKGLGRMGNLTVEVSIAEDKGYVTGEFGFIYASATTVVFPMFGGHAF